MGCDTDDGETVTAKVLQKWIARAQKRAGIRDTGAIRVLRARHNRHTFCSHLAMAGVPAMETQRLAGHANLTTTLKYMHLAPNSEQHKAVGMLEKLRSGG